MDHRGPKPRVSRETRLLLTTAFLALVSLWVLARVRFPDRPAAPTPVQPLLTQLAPRPTFDDLAGDVAQLQPRIAPMLIPFDPWSSEAPVPGAAHDPLPALRTGGDAAIVPVDAIRGLTPIEPGEHVVRIDSATRLALVRLPGPPALPPVPWSTSQPQRPRYLVAADVSAAGLSLRPVFIGSLASVSSPAWPGPIWIVPPQTDLVRGSFVFTSDALLVGLVVDHNGRLAIVPGDVLLAEAERLGIPRVSTPGHLGIDVQPLTPPIAKATGAASGVVVTHVDTGGPAASMVAVGDVLEAADGNTLWTPLHWDTRMARLTASETITVRLLRAGESRDVLLVAAPRPAPPGSPSLGLTLRSIRGAGAEVIAVQRGSIAETAGIRAGDVITLIAGVKTPSAAEIRRTFAAASPGQALLVALTRRDTHVVTALEKR